MAARAAMRVGMGSRKEGRVTREGHPGEGGGERGAWGQVEWEYSPDTAMGSSDHPGLADEGTPTEVEAASVLGSGVRSRGRLRLHLGMKHLVPCPTPG